VQPCRLHRPEPVSQPRMIEKSPPCGRQFDAASAPRHELRANLEFQFSHLAAQIRLSRVQALFSSKGQASFLCHRDEKPQMPQFHRPIPYFTGMPRSLQSLSPTRHGTPLITLQTGTAGPQTGTGARHGRPFRKDCSRHWRFARHGPRCRARTLESRRAGSGSLQYRRERSRSGRCGVDAIQADLSAPDGAHNLAGKVRSIVGGRLDILVANAGVAKAATIEDTTVEDFDRLFAVNVRAPFFLVQQLLPILGRGSSVVLVSSLGAHAVVGTLPAYSATKGAIDTLVKHFASALGGRGIRVNAVAPGVINTDMSSFAKTDAGRDYTLGMQALQRIGEAEDVGPVVAFLASDAARWITGETYGGKHHSSPDRYLLSMEARPPAEGNSRSRFIDRDCAMGSTTTTHTQSTRNTYQEEGAVQWLTW